MNKLFLAGGIGVALIGALTGGFAAGRWSAPDEREQYILRRAWVLTEQAQRTPQGGALLIGDSLTERSGFQTLCGLPVFNAGVSMARLSDMVEAGPELARSLQPELTMVALGTNDARRGMSLAAWREEMDRLLGNLPRPLIVVSLPAMQAEAAPFNAALVELADKHGAVLVPPIAYETSDGLHQSPAGAVTWREAVAESCR
ncbi:MAG: SGNH/GDSL hydrolase family protein [Erythrobacter sp.]|nr:MAG: SGNH/GDSL hydrolase family protein [Erythrobacter sp.]